MPPSPHSRVSVPPLTRRVTGWVTGAALLAGTTALLLVVPRSAGTTWVEVAALARDVRPVWLLALSGVWLAGLAAHSLVLTSSLPGLSARRAVGLNLAGSAVANTVPLGGAVSVGLTSAMVRSWGFTPVAMGAFLAVSGVWNLLGRLAGGLVAMVWVVHALPGSRTAATAAASIAVSVTVIAVAAAGLVSERGAARWGLAAAALTGRLRTLPGSERRGRAERRRDAVVTALAVVRARRDVLRLVRASWARLSLGMTGYLALLVLLLLICLRALGDPSSLALAVAAVGVERLVTAVPLTPGGAGVGEVALVACLTAGGVDPLVAVAAALTYRAFTFFMEIPVGFVVAGVWGLAARRRRSMATAQPVAG